MTVEVAPMHWIIPGFLVEGLTVFGAKPKIGKTTMSMDWSIGIAYGEMLLGLPEYKAVRGRTLYISVDDGKINRFQERLTKRTNGHGLPELLTVSFNWPRMDEHGGGGLDMVKRFLDASPEKVEVLVIDVLQKFLPEYVEDASAYQKLQRYLPHVRKLADEYHIAVVGLMHMHKDTNDKDWTSGFYGNTAVVAEADNVIGLLEGNNGARVLKTRGRDLGEDEFLTEYDEATERVSIAQQGAAIDEIRRNLSKGAYTAKPSNAQDIVAVVLDSIPECEDMSSSQVEQAANELGGINSSTVRGALRELRVAKKIDVAHHNETKRYRMPNCAAAAA